MYQFKAGWIEDEDDIEVLESIESGQGEYGDEFSEQYLNSQQHEFDEDEDDSDEEEEEEELFYQNAQLLSQIEEDEDNDDEESGDDEDLPPELLKSQNHFDMSQRTYTKKCENKIRTQKIKIINCQDFKIEYADKNLNHIIHGCKNFKIIYKETNLKEQEQEKNCDTKQKLFMENCQDFEFEYANTNLKPKLKDCKGFKIIHKIMNSSEEPKAQNNGNFFVPETQATQNDFVVDKNPKKNTDEQKTPKNGKFYIPETQPYDDFVVNEIPQNKNFSQLIFPPENQSKQNFLTNEIPNNNIFSEPLSTFQNIDPSCTAQNQPNYFEELKTPENGNFFIPETQPNQNFLVDEIATKNTEEQKVSKNENFFIPETQPNQNFLVNELSKTDYISELLPADFLEEVKTLQNENLFPFDNQSKQNFQINEIPKNNFYSVPPLETSVQFFPPPPFHKNQQNFSSKQLNNDQNLNFGFGKKELQNNNKYSGKFFSLGKQLSEKQENENAKSQNIENHAKNFDSNQTFPTCIRSTNFSSDKLKNDQNITFGFGKKGIKYNNNNNNYSDKAISWQKQLSEKQQDGNAKIENIENLDQNFDSNRTENFSSNQLKNEQNFSFGFGKKELTNNNNNNNNNNKTVGLGKKLSEKQEDVNQKNQNTENHVQNSYSNLMFSTGIECANFSSNQLKNEQNFSFGFGKKELKNNNNNSEKVFSLGKKFIEKQEDENPKIQNIENFDRNFDSNQTFLTCIESATFPGCFLRGDNPPKKFSPHGSGVVNIQFGAQSLETWKVHNFPENKNILAFEMSMHENVFLRVSPTFCGPKTVNLIFQNPKNLTEFEKWELIDQKDGNFGIKNLKNCAFPSLYLSMDGEIFGEKRDYGFGNVVLVDKCGINEQFYVYGFN